MNSEQIKSLLVNPKFWGAIIGLLTTLGISYFKDVDPNTLIAAIVLIMGVFVGGSAYENGKKAVAAAHVDAATTAARAFRMAQPPAQMPGLKEYITTNAQPPAAPTNSEQAARDLQDQVSRMIYPQETPGPSSPINADDYYRNLTPYLTQAPKE